MVQERGTCIFRDVTACKGASMRVDEEMFASFQCCAEPGALPLVHAARGDIPAGLQAHGAAEGVTGPDGLPKPQLGRSKARPPTAPSWSRTRLAFPSASSQSPPNGRTRPSAARARGERPIIAVR